MLSPSQIDPAYAHLVPYGLAVLRGAVDGPDCDSQLKALRASVAWQKLHFGTYENGRLVALDREAVDVEALVNYDYRFPDPFEHGLKAGAAVLADALWNLSDLSFSRMTASFLGAGMALAEHKDSRFSDTPRLVSVVTYLNGSFSGGDLILRHLGVTITPNRGDMVLFYSEHEHEVTEVTAGDRYSGVFFLERQIS